MKSIFQQTVKPLVIALFLLTFIVSVSYAKTLRLLSSWPKNMAFVEGCLGSFNQNLSRLSDGTITTRYSGPEIIPTLEQFQPVQAGVFDLLLTINGYHIGTTVIGAVVDTMDSDPVKRRKHGIFQYVDRHYNQLGMKLIAIFPVTDIHMLLRDPLEGRNPSLSGLKIRTSPIGVPMIKTMGGSPVNLAAGEVYTALQKGVIDGSMLISYGAGNYKWHEVTRYYAKPSFGFMSIFLFMNLDKYNALTPAEQGILAEAGRVSEIEAAAYFREKKADEIAKLKRLGLKETRMTESDARRVNALLNGTIWGYAIKKAGKTAEDLKALATREGLIK